MQTTATIDSDGNTVTMTKGSWSITFPLDELPNWIAFYRRQQVMFAPHARSYDTDVLALEALLAGS